MIEPQTPPLDWSLPGRESGPVRVLVVDDQEIIRLGLVRILAKNGFYCLEASGGEQALEILGREPVELVLSDLLMPGMNGLELVKAMASRIPETAVVMVTAMDSLDMAMECLRHGAYGYLLKPAQTNAVLIQVANALRRRMLELDFRDREAVLARKVREQTQEIRASREEIAFRLISASEHRDNETGAHVRRIGLFALEVARLLHWNHEEQECILGAAPMHDIGKIGVPDRILQKEGPLTDEEWIIMRTHTLMGTHILQGSTVPFIQMGARIAACHHEKWDGTGYPAGMEGERIPLEARITALVDVYDALSCRRVYKHPWNEDRVLAFLQTQRGVHFDPALVDLFLEHYGVFREILQDHPDVFVVDDLPV